MVTSKEFQAYLQSVINALQRNTQQGGQDHCISTLVDLPLQVQATTSFISEADGQSQEKREQFAVLEGLRKYASNHALLVGKPGSGKTTSLRQLLWEETERCIQAIVQAEIEIPPIPVLIELRNLRGSVLVAIQEKLSWWLKLDEQALKSLLRDRRLLILLDGLNELPNDQTWKEVDQFRQLCAELNIPLIITTRELGSGLFDGNITKLEMLPLTASQMQEFVWRHLPETGGELLRQIQGRLQELAETPLLLQMLCEVFAERRGIPKSRGDLFRKEFARRYEKFKPEHLRNISEDSRRFTFDLLCYLAFEMVQGESHIDPCKPTASWITVSKIEATKILARFLTGEQIPTLEETAKAKEWLEDLVEWHLLQVANDSDHIEFHHQLFQEYYAAEWLEPKLAKSNDEELKYYLTYLKWTESLAMSMSFVQSQDLAERIVVQALDVDLYLGARLAGEAQSPFQQATIDALIKKTLGLSLTIWLLEQTQSPNALPFLLDTLSNGYSDTRWRAARALGNFSDQIARSALIGALKDPDPSVRRKAAESLGKLDDVEAIPNLCQLLNDKDWLVRSFVIEILGKLDRAESVDCLKSALKNEDSTVRGKAAEHLGQRNPQEVIALLSDEFFNGDVNTQKSVLSLLGKTKTVEAIPILISALSEDNWLIRSEAVSQIGLLGIWLDKSLLEKASITLAHILKSDPEASVRSSAAIQLGIIGDSQIVPVLVEALSQDSQVVRASVANALGRLQDKSAISSLINALQDDDYVCEAVIRAIRALNAVEALPAIRKLVASKVLNIRREAILTLGFIGDSKDLPFLYKALQDKEFSIRLRAAYSLSLLNNRKGVSILEDALKTGNKDARELALNGLKNFKGKVGLLSILSRAFRDDEYSIRKASVDFLKLFKDNPEIADQLKIALNSPNEDICRHAMDASEVLGNFEVLPRLRQLSETIIVVERPLDAIAAIQSRCGFYNYEIAESFRLELLDQKKSEQSKKTQGVPNVTNNFNFDQRGATIGVNVANEGSNIRFIQHAKQSINISEQDLAEAAQKIQSLLNQLAQTYPTTTETQQQTFIQKFLERIESTPDLIKIILAGGIEGLKTLCPPAGISIEVIRSLYEVIQKRYGQS
ncbi:hypothetical protein C7B61_00685 [filamentous cyanobacterium CCP1]|nr:hypothetical protein C7B76_02820 [filamentous cyanobacterium CCP2]PSB68475.1 hypothetical protein C7B61_00685 [filamentous cyanobacterium CCP1]